MPLMGWVAANLLIGGQQPVLMGNDNFTAAPSGTFRTQDGYINIAANKQEQWEALCDEIELPGLKTDRYDAVISCVTITEERKKEVDFSDPYYDAGQIVAVRADEAAIRSKEDLKGKRIGAQSNTTGLEQAKGLGGSVVKEYEDVNMAFQDLANNQIDAVINDEPVSRRLAAVKPGFKVVGHVFTKEQYGIVVKKGNAALLADINRALKKIRESGELQKLKEKWITNPAK
jgi:polar amino acid transport system substrate-binding protein